MRKESKFVKESHELRWGAMLIRPVAFSVSVRYLVRRTRQVNPHLVIPHSKYVKLCDSVGCVVRLNSGAGLLMDPAGALKPTAFCGRLDRADDVLPALWTCERASGGSGASDPIRGL